MAAPAPLLRPRLLPTGGELLVGELGLLAEGSLAGAYTQEEGAQRTGRVFAQTQAASTSIPPAGALPCLETRPG